MDFLSPRSRERFETIHEHAQLVFYDFLQACHDNKFDVQITSGSRSFKEQDDLYAIGRTKPGRIITNAKGGQSMHNYGIAIDIVIINRKGECDWRLEMYEMLWRVAKKKDLNKQWLCWGGNWKSFKDSAHFDLSNGEPIEKIKELYPPYKPP